MNDAQGADAAGERAQGVFDFVEVVEEVNICIAVDGSEGKISGGFNGDEEGVVVVGNAAGLSAAGGVEEDFVAGAGQGGGVFEGEMTSGQTGLPVYHSAVEGIDETVDVSGVGVLYEDGTGREATLLVVDGEVVSALIGEEFDGAVAEFFCGDEGNADGGAMSGEGSVPWGYLADVFYGAVSAEGDYCVGFFGDGAKAAVIFAGPFAYGGDVAAEGAEAGECAGPDAGEYAVGFGAADYA